MNILTSTSVFVINCNNLSRKKSGINVDLVIDYLEIKKREDFYERLRENYNNPHDFKIIRAEKKSGKKGVKYTEYYINLDTFERICMLSKSKKANKVRDYFIILRKFITYYKNNIDKMILDKIKNNKKCVYVLLVDKKTDLYKIGQTSEFKKRLMQYATGHSKHPDIKFIMLIDDPLQVENCVKIFIKSTQYKKNKEIYKIPISTLKEIIVGCGEMSQDINLKLLNEHDKTKDGYIIYDEIPFAEFVNNDNEIIGFEKNMRKRLPKNLKKSSKKLSKKISKKSSKKSTKKISKK